MSFLGVLEHINADGVPHLPSVLLWSSYLNSNGMCGDGNYMAIILGHRSTALDFNSQVLNHMEFWIIHRITLQKIYLSVYNGNR